MLFLKPNIHQDVGYPLISANLPFAENVLLNPTLLKLWSTVAHDLFCRYPATNTQKDILRKMLHSKNARGVDDAMLGLCPSGTFFIIIILTHICDSNKSSIACLRGRGHYWKVENTTNMLFRGAQKVKFFLHFILNCWWQSLILYRVEYLQNFDTKIKWKPRYSPAQGNI